MLRVERTTDRKYLGLVMPIDPRSPPESIPAGDAVFEPDEWTEIAPGLWRVRNGNYCVIAREVN